MDRSEGNVRKQIGAAALIFLGLAAYLVLLSATPEAQTTGDNTVDVTDGPIPGGTTGGEETIVGEPLPFEIVQEFEQEAESGDVEQSLEVGNTGDNINQCVTVLQSANTGNVQNAQGVNQVAQSEGGDVAISGSSLILSPEVAQECVQILEQAADAQSPSPQYDSPSPQPDLSPSIETEGSVAPDPPAS